MRMHAWEGWSDLSDVSDGSDKLGYDRGSTVMLPCAACCASCQGLESPRSFGLNSDRRSAMIVKSAKASPAKVPAVAVAEIVGRMTTVDFPASTGTQRKRPFAV